MNDTLSPTLSGHTPQGLITNQNSVREGAVTSKPSYNGTQVQFPRRSVLFPRPSSVNVWDGAPVPSPAPLSRAPSATPQCFHIQTKGMSTSLTHLFGVRNKTTLIQNHTLSPTLFGHTPQGLAIYLFLTVEGCNPAFTLL